MLFRIYRSMRRHFKLSFDALLHPKSILTWLSQSEGVMFNPQPPVLPIKQLKLVTDDRLQLRHTLTTHMGMMMIRG